MRLKVKVRIDFKPLFFFSPLCAFLFLLFTFCPCAIYIQPCTLTLVTSLGFIFSFPFPLAPFQSPLRFLVSSLLFSAYCHSDSHTPRSSCLMSDWDGPDTMSHKQACQCVNFSRSLQTFSNWARTVTTHCC